MRQLCPNGAVLIERVEFMMTWFMEVPTSRSTCGGSNKRTSWESVFLNLQGGLKDSLCPLDFREVGPIFQEWLDTKLCGIMLIRFHHFESNMQILERWLFFLVALEKKEEGSLTRELPTEFWAIILIKEKTVSMFYFWSMS